MKTFIRLVVLIGLGYLGYILCLQALAQQAIEGADQSKVIVTFAAVILIALVCGMILTLWVVPTIGETLGNVFVNPDQAPEKDPHHDARVKIAQGDYQGALAEYEAILNADPADTLAMTEASRVYLEKLHDPVGGAAIYEAALEREWPPEQLAFLGNRLADIYWTYQADADRARGLLEQIVGSMPGTRQAANANHRLHEIDRAVASGKMPVAPSAGGDAGAEVEE